MYSTPQYKYKRKWTLQIKILIFGFISASENVGTVGLWAHNTAIQSTKCQLTLGFVASLNLDRISQKLRDKNKTTRLSYYLCAMVLLLLFSLWHKTNAKQNTSIFSPKSKWFPVKHSMSKQLRNQINSIPIYYVTIKDTLLIGN